MTYYYVATVDGDVFTSSPSLERIINQLDAFNKNYPKYLTGHNVQILCYERRGEIIKWKPKTTKNQ